MAINDLAINDLLNRVSNIHEKYKGIYKSTGEKFNIFQILNVDTYEVRICRFLSELLSPTGSHYQGSLFFNLFLKDILEPELKISENDIAETATVFREFTTDKNRRIDIVIKIVSKTQKMYFIPIEVKIYAEDLPSQCKDYYEEAQKYSSDKNEVKLFYLTRYGDRPSDESTEGMADEQKRNIICISFAKDILLWIDDCINQSEIIFNAAIREVLKQFSDTVKKFTNQAEDKEKVDIIAEILKNSDSLESAVKIRSSLNEATDKKRCEFLEKLRNRLEKKGLKENKDFKFNPDDKTSSFKFSYGKVSDVYVCLGTHKDKTYVSYYSECQNEDIKKFYNNVSSKRNNGRRGGYGFFYWEPCTLDGANEAPDFENPNEALYQLCEAEKLEKFVDVCVDKIIEFLDFPLE